jgi:hypothetical protein
MLDCIETSQKVKSGLFEHFKAKMYLIGTKISTSSIIEKNIVLTSTAFGHNSHIFEHNLPKSTINPRRCSLTHSLINMQLELVFCSWQMAIGLLCTGIDSCRKSYNRQFPL